MRNTGVSAIGQPGDLGSPAAGDPRVAAAAAITSRPRLGAAAAAASPPGTGICADGAGQHELSYELPQPRGYSESIIHHDGLQQQDP